MGKVVLKIENLSKIYRLGEIGSGTISHDLNRWWASVRGKEDPNSLVGQENDRTKKAQSDFVYALREINFEVNQGDVLGIIGKNGAGKSTLLKIISKITSPSTGTIKAKGRIASLLEVGTGMHPEMTARENIYLNGAILGMRKWEIDKKFDEILDFAGVNMYVDTPIKRFSSGMSVRLGFAVAAFLEPEILIVDEVLAVGDAEFQKKAIGKMKDVSSNDGRTVLFVSHNMASVKNLCTSAIVMDKGGVGFSGSVTNAIDYYFSGNKLLKEKGVIPINFERYNTGELKIKKIAIIDKSNRDIDEVYFKSNIRILINIDCQKKINDILLDVKIVSLDGIVISHSINTWGKSNTYSLEIGNHSFLAVLNNNFQPGTYSITVGVHKFDGTTIEYLENIFDFTILDVSENAEKAPRIVHGYINLESTWEKLI